VETRGLEEGAQAFADLDQGKSAAAKIVLHPAWERPSRRWLGGSAAIHNSSDLFSSNGRCDAGQGRSVPWFGPRGPRQREQMLRSSV